MSSFYPLVHSCGYYMSEYQCGPYCVECISYLCSTQNVFRWRVFLC